MPFQPTSRRSLHPTRRLVFFLFALFTALAPRLAAQANPGTITGRILNEVTGQYLRSASVVVVGTSIATISESGGTYTLTGVPPGTVRIAVSFLGLTPMEANVSLAAGQTMIQDFSMSDRADGAGVVKMQAFRVASEREGNYKAIQDQKSALEIKSVMSSDAFGDVSEGNVGEFLKLMPGVMMDYVEADVRTVSIGGLDPKYALVTMDGSPVASAGSSNIATGRAFEFEQLSISSIETVEISKTPTPDVAGSALAGVVNLRSKGAFDRKGRQVRWSASSQFNSRQMTLNPTPGPADRKVVKLQPNASLEFSDVYFDRLGVLAGFNFARTFVEQNTTAYSYAFTATQADNATEIPRLSNFQLIDTPKTTTRTNYNLRLDFKVSPELMVWVRADYNDYEARNFQRNLTFRLNNAVNGPATTDPRAASAAYSLASQTATSATSEISFNNSFNKHGATTTVATGGSFKRGAFRNDTQAQVSIGTNFYDDLSYGFFHTGSAGQTPNLTLRWDRKDANDAAINFTQLAGPDWRNLSSYTAAPNPAARLPFNSKDQRWTAKTDFRYNGVPGRIPVLLKWGGDIGLQVRNVDRGTIPVYTYLGPDGRAGTGDERWAVEPAYTSRNLAGGNLQGIPAIDRFAMAREYGAHPERFTAPTAAQLLTSQLTTHWDVKEQIDSAYQQTIVKLTPKFDLAPGVRLERTRSFGRGPTDRGNAYAQTLLTGNPRGTVPTTSLDYLQARYGHDLVNRSDYRTWLKYLHATYRWSSELIFRASFNDSVTRPDLDNLSGGVTLSPDTNPPTARIPNSTLVPEHGRNLFASAEYYFPKGAGYLTFSGARRDISNLIRSSVVDVPIGGTFGPDDEVDLGGYRVTTTDNIGRAHVTTGELSYRQNFVFLPGIWRRLSFFANYTRLRFDDYENFRRPRNVANGGLAFEHRGLSLRWNTVWVPKFRRAATPANGWATFDGERLTHDVQLAYRLGRGVTVFASGRNILNQSTRSYYGSSQSILSRYSDYGAVWNLGLRGVF